MMRYQRVSPDFLGLPNGSRKPVIRPCSTDEGTTSNYSPFDPKPFRVRSVSGSASASPTVDNHHFASSSDSPDPNQGTNGRYSAAGGGGDVLLQWGHRKRSRGSRTGGDDSTAHSRPKIQRRAAIAGAERIAAAAAAAAMPPPCGRGANLRASMPQRESLGTHRTLEERSDVRSRSEKRSPPSPPQKRSPPATSQNQAKMAAAATAPHNGFGPDRSPKPNPSDQDSGSGCGQEKGKAEQLEWPRIYIALSRKEKEEDFLVMKGTKLPQRPKKRAKNIDKTLQYCFPGMWLSDLTRGRYEVREKKCVKKKRRGLKGMESMDSDSE